MKLITNILVIGIAVLSIKAKVPTKNTYTLTNDYAVSINGTSNLHNWDEKVKTVTGEGVVNRVSDIIFDLESISIKMDVHSTKSDMGAIMNNNTYKALKADANPQIIFMLTSPVRSLSVKSNEKIISAKGNLTIAGVTKAVEIQVKISMSDSGRLVFEGSQSIQMTDYGIKPPVALFGTLKTGDEIKINFKTNFSINN
jgi:hypothetical protein